MSLLEADCAALEFSIGHPEYWDDLKEKETDIHKMKIEGTLENVEMSPEFIEWVKGNRRIKNE